MLKMRVCRELDRIYVQRRKYSFFLQSRFNEQKCMFSFDKRGRGSKKEQLILYTQFQYKMFGMRELKIFACHASYSES